MCPSLFWKQLSIKYVSWGLQWMLWLDSAIKGTVLCVTICHIKCSTIITWSIFSPNPHNRHPIARPWRRDIGCLQWVQTLDLCNGWVTAVLYVISCCIELHNNGARLYISYACILYYEAPLLPSFFISIAGSQSGVPQRPPSPMFVSVPPRTQRLVHSEAYLRYVTCRLESFIPFHFWLG